MTDAQPVKGRRLAGRSPSDTLERPTLGHDVQFSARLSTWKTPYSVLVAHILRNATVQYGDFIGSAAADRADAGSLGLNEVIGIDAEKWWILAVEIYAAEPADLTEDCVRVFAVNRSREGINNAAELQAYGAEHGTIPVTEFQVHDVSAVELVRNSFKRLAVQLRSRSLEQLELSVVSEDSLNYSGE